MADIRLFPIQDDIPERPKQPAPPKAPPKFVPPPVHDARPTPAPKAPIPLPVKKSQNTSQLPNRDRRPDKSSQNDDPKDLQDDDYGLGVLAIQSDQQGGQQGQGNQSGQNDSDNPPAGEDSSSSSKSGGASSNAPQASAGRDAVQAAQISAHIEAVADSAELSADQMAELMPGASESGIFEVLFPNGDAMGVVVDIRHSMVSYLLNPTTEQFRTRLRGKRMELEGSLRRRIGRNVQVTVL